MNRTFVPLCPAIGQRPCPVKGILPPALSLLLPTLLNCGLLPLPISAQNVVSYRRGSTILEDILPPSPEAASLRDAFTGKEDQGPDFSIPYTDFGARQYNPTLCRWLVPDPLGVTVLENVSYRPIKKT